ncbi:hypothetical protein AYI68_g7900 [Smittium mucronatum]|uniref:Uncharacterized protein n=1 Tax=Smittium mucronatum TaxID=133383 RepID=A0A1R0GMG4_9FUNG|nr:hypothetical protein AYI68_g7900 [Smittium mucronatum]
MSKKTEKYSRIFKLFYGEKTTGTQDSSFSKFAPAYNTDAAVPKTATNNHPSQKKFSGENVAAERGPTRDPINPFSIGITLHAQVGMKQTREQHLSQEHRGKGAQDPFQGIEPEKNGFLFEQNKSFCSEGE